jgi:hypothetical protein
MTSQNASSHLLTAVPAALQVYGSNGELLYRGIRARVGIYQVCSSTLGMLPTVWLVVQTAWHVYLPSTTVCLNETAWHVYRLASTLGLFPTALVGHV